jgi:hypothetical protein
MFRYLIVGAVLFTFLTSMIVLATRPDLVEKDIKKPLTEWNASREVELWKTAKEKAWDDWATQIRLPADCDHPRTEVRKLECKNKWQLHTETFERTWVSKVQSGWKPAGVF